MVLEYLPLSHERQRDVVEPETARYLPMSQGLQSLSDLRPRASPPKPGGQSAQAELPVSFWYLPRAHEVQLEEPVTEAKVPAAHLSHTDAADSL
jgi:hypothetical protein